MKKISELFTFLVVKFSVYLNRHVFVTSVIFCCPLPLTPGILLKLSAEMLKYFPENRI